VILDRLIQAARAAFGEGSFREMGDPLPAIVFPAVHPDVGDIEVQADAGELVVILGRFTHTHHANYDDGLSASEAEERVVEQVIAYLREIFADRVVMWGSHRGAGGSYARGREPLMVVVTERGPEYVWSGPLR
jgi:hypothetical protein